MPHRPDSTRVVDLFTEALTRPETERAGFVTTAAAGDPTLHDRVTRLLKGATFMQDPAADLQRALRHEEDKPGERAGPYELVRPIASGGMGTVWLARRADETFEAVVALKLIKRGMDTDDILARFRAERQLLANLRHPNIAALLDGGATDDGRPYLVMEYVDGAPIDQYCDTRKLSIRERIALFRQACAAVEHAHRATIVHRDLKPANILVDSAGTPKLLDFGIAKVLAHSAEATATRHRILTPGYASPEQVRAEPITTATDVYSLGVVLYELLTGRRPYKTDGGSGAALERAICEVEPPRPSAAISHLGRAALRALSGDLDTIVMMALRKEPARRYGSVEQFSEDLRRYLEGLPVLARPDTIRYRAGKFVRRNKVLVGAATAVLASLITGLAMSTSMYLRAESASRAEAAQKTVAQNKTVEAERLRSLAEWRAYSAHIAAALGAIRAGDVAGAKRSLEQTAPELRGWEHRYAVGRADGSLRALHAHDDFIYDLELSPDARTLASAGRDGLVKLWDARTLTLKDTIEGFNKNVGNIAFSPDGSLLAIPATSADTLIWDIAARRAAQVLKHHTGSVRAVAFLPDGRLVTGATDHRAILWARDEQGVWKPTLNLRNTGQVRGVSASPDGSLIAAACFDNTVRLWDVATAADLGALLGHQSWVYSAQFSPDGTTLATASIDQTVRLWNVSTRETTRVLRGHTERVSNARFSPDGRIVASASWDRSVRLWDAHTGESIATLLGHENNVFGLAFSPDSRLLYSAADDGAIRVWDVPRSWIRESERDDRRILAIVTTPDWVAAALTAGTRGRPGGAYLWDAATNRPAVTLDTGFTATNYEADSLALSPDSSLLAAGHSEGTVAIWDTASFTQPGPLAARGSTRVSGPVRALAFCDNSTFLAGYNDGTVRLWDAASVEELARFKNHSDVVRVLLADDGRFVSGAQDGLVLVRDLRTGAELGRVFPGGAIIAAAISPDGTRLAVGSGRENAVVTLYSWPGLERQATLAGHTHHINALAFHPDGSRLATASWDHTVKIWDPTRGLETATLYGHDYGVFSAAWTPDGRDLLTGAADGSVHIWSGRERAPDEPRTK